MDIEIEVVGKPNKWVLNQSPIRIGRGAKCEVFLPVKQFPSVAISHGELEIVNGMLRVGARESGQGDLFLNDEVAETGAVILSGDTLRVGEVGPELRVLFEERAAPRSSYEATRVIQVADVPGREQTRVMSAPESSVDAPARSASATSHPARPPMPAVSPTRVEMASGHAQNPKAAEVGLGAFEARDRWPEPRKGFSGIPAKAGAPPPAAASPISGSLQSKLTILQIMQGVSLLIMLVLAYTVFQLRSEVAKDHDELIALRTQEQNAVGQFTPALDARLNVFGQRMDSLDEKLKEGEDRMERGMDAKMKEAQVQLFNSLDAKMKDTEDRMVTRLNAELPHLLDKYIDAKLAKMKH
ncbi:MAG TPA: FHA domain-containing protein [Terracidiphilus sp.]|jgi:hypothetical protein|nr:FHA domain-containing protein [Terracidiphilus sp.]